MISPELLSILACPENHMPLKNAGSSLLEKLNNEAVAGRLKNRDGRAVEAPLEGGLVRDDGAIFYPVRQGIPVMLVEEAIPLAVGESL